MEKNHLKKYLKHLISICPSTENCQSIGRNSPDASVPCHFEALCH